MRDVITEIWSTARRNKLRTALTGFAVAWGIFMLIVLLGAGNGLINAMVNNNSRFIANSMAIFGGTTSKPYKGMKEGRYVPLKDKDITITQTQFTENIDEGGARVSQQAVISMGENYISTRLCGVYPNHQQIDKIDMLYGRFINNIDLKEKRKVLVLGDQQAKELTRDVASLVGKHLKVGAFAFQVVGIFKEPQNGNADAMTAYSTLETVYGKSNQPERIVFSFHGLPTAEANEAFEKEYRAKLNEGHQAAADDESALWIWNRFTQSLQMNTGMKIIRTALWIVGLFTLLSGIVGVSNIMLITVKERTREFGIRKAIGAKPWSILKLIIIESVIITTFFGYIGMVLGVAANEYMDATLGHDVIDTGLFQTTMFVNPTIGIDVCLEATMVMVIAGTLAGLIPAMKAARIRPIEALRAE